MSYFISYMPLIAGLWLIGIALMMTTKNVISSVIFKVIPFFLGMGCLFSAGKTLGWL